MSGGSWDYFSYKLEDVADRLVEEKSPLRRAFGEHLRLCAKGLHAIEWSDSGDTGERDWIKDVRAAMEDNTAERESAAVKKGVEELRDALNDILQNTPGQTRR